MAGSGGAWKVAYADFVTAMMAFFMVMWLTSQKPDVKEAIAEYFRDPFASEPGVAAHPKQSSLPSKLPKGKVAKGKIGFEQSGPGDGSTPGLDENIGQVSVTSQYPDVIRIAVLFTPTSAELTDEEREKIDSNLHLLLGKTHRIEIRSHCILQPLGRGSDHTDHWQLCYERCLAVKDELEKHGIDPRRFRLSQAESNEPASRGLTQDELKKNSRVEIIMLPELSHHAQSNTL
ncbi:OmpA/MotB family protein [Aeoliella sp. SH292]|uniref:OmpA/MotB family protein n=1 Tax=Aeoliella sp. SH292 TaxID=3454464 RepID=UPI003F9539F1